MKRRADGVVAWAGAGSVGPTGDITEASAPPTSAPEPAAAAAAAADASLHAGDTAEPKPEEAAAIAAAPAVAMLSGLTAAVETAPFGAAAAPAPPAAARPTARLRLTDLTEAVLSGVLASPVLGLQDAAHAARSCRCLRDAVQRCEELWARLYGEHFGGIATAEDAGGRGTGRGAAGGTAGEGSAGGRAGDGGRLRSVPEAVGLSRQASMVSPDPRVAGDGGGGRGGGGGSGGGSGSGGGGGSGSGSGSAGQGLAVRQAALQSAGTSEQPLDAPPAGAPVGRVAVLLRPATGGSRSGSGSGAWAWAGAGAGIVAITRGSSSCSSGNGSGSGAGGTRVMGTAAGSFSRGGGGGGGPAGRSGSRGGGGGGGGGGSSWQERFKARYMRESSERRHRRRVALYRLQAAVQEARSELAAARRRVSEEAVRLEGLQRLVSRGPAEWLAGV
ncbi:hypothetical protein PLESTM_000827900 [Pleodorina starrii]|nr:hypothetical protein PLESTM_000827900 [Pleodorina starrii]